MLSEELTVGKYLLRSYAYFPPELQEYKMYTFPLAVAIVLSGMYEDDLDNAEDVVYTGQGGHNLTGDKRQIRDQVLERGNLALKVCILNIFFFSWDKLFTCFICEINVD